MNKQSEMVILVDNEDRAIGASEKLAAHRAGLLHRAFSIFLVNEAGQWLLQRRHPRKYHSGGLWTNACCGHPRPGEVLVDAAQRRLMEEMSLDCPLTELFAFRYSASFDGTLFENEVDHVFTGVAATDPVPDPSEVDAWRWVDPDQLRTDVSESPLDFTVWFRLSWERVARDFLRRRQRVVLR